MVRSDRDRRGQRQCKCEGRRCRAFGSLRAVCDRKAASIATRRSSFEGLSFSKLQAGRRPRCQQIVRNVDAMTSRAFLVTWRCERVAVEDSWLITIHVERRLHSHRHLELLKPSKPTARVTVLVFKPIG
jgi:hypothetical protein